VAPIDIVDASTDSHWEQFAKVDAVSFLGKLEESERFVSTLRERAHVRLALDGDRVVGGYALMPMGQFFGGRSVPSAPVAAVCILPEARRGGLGMRLLDDLCRTAAADGSALAPLYPATVQFYRRGGWGTADRTLRHFLPTRLLRNLRTAAGELVTDPEAAERDALIRSLSMGYNGTLDRPEWWWDFQPELNVERFVYGWREDGRLTGVLRYRQGRTGNEAFVAVEEWWTATAAAATSLGALLGGHSSMVQEVEFYASVLPHRNDFEWLIDSPERDLRSESRLPWMQRLTDSARALEQRGWPAGIDAVLELEISDPFDGTSCLRLEVSGGRAQARPGGSGAVGLDSATLSSWYSGGLSATSASRLGLLRAQAGEIEVMDALTRDLPVWLGDAF
jgi:predicted acetyltransferase